jgi:UDP-glucose 4-epimerase
MSPQSILVTGGAGYIGSICVERLLAEGHTVTVLDNLSVGHRAAVASEAAFHQADIGNLAALRVVFKQAQPEAILHFAGSALVGESMEQPLKYFQNNTANALNLLHCAAEFGVGKFIFSSTCSTYGIPETIPISEATPQRPVNPYGESKRMFEQMLKWHAEQTTTEAVIFRYFNAAGATAKLGEHHEPETHLIPRILQTALGRHESFSIFGTEHPTPDGTCVRDYIHVSDLAEAHLLALHPGITGDYNLGRGHGDSVLEILQACREITDHPIPSEDHPARAGDPHTLIAAVDKARAHLQWEARHPSIRDIIASAWQWHQANPNGYPQ